MYPAHTTHIFVGERPSPTALEKGWSWEDGRLAGKQLKDALETIGLNYTQQVFYNIFQDHQDIINPSILSLLKESTLPIVAMGNKVEKVFIEHGIEHVKIVHPASRGKIRKKERYLAHIQEKLCVERKGKPSVNLLHR